MDETLKKALLNRSKRLYLCERSVLLFGMYYFRHYWTHNSPPFHKELCENLDDLFEGQYKHLLLCGFRGCAKTGWAKISLIHQIVFKKRKMCLFVSFDEDSSKDNLFDVALELQTNKYILNDFGQLYFDTSNEKKSQKTGVGNFLTSNGIRVMASSVKKAIRGKTFAGGRPDFVIVDDFENNKTKNSSAETRKVISYFDELFGGLGPGTAVIYCCNRISDTGSVEWLFAKAENNFEWRTWEKAIIENGEITWDRYVYTEKEAVKLNSKIKDKQCWYISLEGLRKTYEDKGIGMFEQEMMNIPVVAGNKFFDTDYIDKRVQYLKDNPVEFETDGDWTIWFRPQIRHEYRIGVDVAEGYGLDSSVIEVFDVTDSKQVAEWSSNTADPDELVTEIIDAHINYIKALVTHERNSVGIAVTSLLKERGYADIMPFETKIDVEGNNMIKKYGWSTNRTSKPKMLYDLKHSFENQEITIYSFSLLKEMRSYSKLDMRHRVLDPTDFITRHFDKVMAMCIVNQSKNFGGLNYGMVPLTKKTLPFKTKEAYDGLIANR